MMLDQLSRKFLDDQDEHSALNLVRAARCTDQFHVGIVLAELFERMFPRSLHLKEEYAVLAVYTGDHVLAYDTYQRGLEMRGLSQQNADILHYNQHFCIEHVEERYAWYNLDRVREVTTALRTPRLLPQITVTVTSCRRIDLFRRTINSFLNCCLDLNLVDRWICVDDNSSSADRAEMARLYPFFEFRLKTHEEKGHPRSMNIIRAMVTTPFVFHMEDDWMFYCRRTYLSDALEVLGEGDGRVFQCLVNKNYAETGEDFNIAGGDFRTTKDGLRYYVHEYVPPGDAPREAVWKAKHQNPAKHCNYWKHFSFRPSLMSTRVLTDLGAFDERVSHFEQEYANRYVGRGWESAFLEGVYSKHIGRLTTERGDKTKTNAYKLNNEAQFFGKETQDTTAARHTRIDIKTFVINLDRRPDRWAEFQVKSKEIPFSRLERYPAVDGTQLISTAQLQRIFDGNDYNMRQGMVGCAMSHLKLCVEFLETDEPAICVLEDDVDFAPDFATKLATVYSKVQILDWDMVYLGHHLFEHHITDDSYDTNKRPFIEQWDRHTSLSRSMGGTGGYLISRAGAEKLLHFINRTGMTNGIDTVQQKAADVMNIYYLTPHLIYSKCFRGNNSLDTDIQYNHEPLTMSVADRKLQELACFTNPVELHNLQTALYSVRDETETLVLYFEHDDPSVITRVEQACVHPCYTLDDKVLFVVPRDQGHPDRYFERLCKSGKFDLSDAILYK